MIGRKFIVIGAAVVAVAGIAALGLYLGREAYLAPPPAEQGPLAGGAAAPVPQQPQEAAPSEEPAKPQAEATGTLTPPAEPTSVPTFDVVVIEPSGEGVIAGRAAPGWQVSVQSRGAKVAVATADLQGEWSVVLEKPLPSGDHMLSLKTLSPDGTRALSSQDSVAVAVGATENKATAPASVEEAAKPVESAPQAETIVPAPPQAEAVTPLSPAPQVAEAEEAPGAANPVEPQIVARATTRAAQESAPAPQAPPKTALVFKTVDYDGKGSETGTVTITGTSEPGATIHVYLDDAPFAKALADRDGRWRVAARAKLAQGQHNFRAERFDQATGVLNGRAAVAFERVTPKPPEPQVAAKAPAGVPTGSATPQVAAAEKPGQEAKEGPIVYVIRRGDTLWAIAKRYLGGGSRYTSIFQDNRAVISNPNMIHPKQEVKVPKP